MMISVIVAGPPIYLQYELLYLVPPIRTYLEDNTFLSKCLSVAGSVVSPLPVLILGLSKEWSDSLGPFHC